MKVAVIGGGISGLTTAFLLKRKRVDVSLFEATENVGGNVQTLQKDGYTIEQGPNSLLKSPRLVELVRMLDLEDKVIAANPEANKRYILWNGKLEAMGPKSFVNGYFGPKTEAAILAFQDATGIKPDGIVGRKTKEALQTAVKSESLLPGMKGDGVEKLQKRLKALGYFDGDVTGLYGQITEKAVSYYQRLNKLAEDGIAGRKTQNAVYAKDAKTEKEAKRSLKYSDVSQQSAEGQEKCDALIEYAKQFLGKPYVLGAEGPNSFDCSGLTWYVYKNFGVTLPRHAREQGYGDYGVKITSKSKLMKGDLVFFNSIRSDSDLCDHVGIYIGDNNIIQSPNTGSHVKISSIANARDYSWGRRVFK
jgi:peptidoglycan hydrolase-like protein with peptidoglycan-binding domain